MAGDEVVLAAVEVGDLGSGGLVLDLADPGAGGGVGDVLGLARRISRSALPAGSGWAIRVKVRVRTRGRAAAAAGSSGEWPSVATR